MAKLIRVGSIIINVDNVTHVELDWNDEGGVVVEFNVAQTDSFNREPSEGRSSGTAPRQISRRPGIPPVRGGSIQRYEPELFPCAMFFDGEQAKALTGFFSDDANVQRLL
jgi:hypothetical protein